MAGFGDIPLKAGFTSMGELADLIMQKKKMQQEAELKKYEIEQMAPYKTAQMNYQNALTASLPMRYLTPQGKLLNEESNLKQGGSPAGTPQGQPIVPGTLPYYDPARLQNTGQPQNPGSQNNNGQLPPVNLNDDQLEKENTIQDFMPDGNGDQGTPNAPHSQNNPQATSANQYNLKNIKNNVPASVLQKNLYATNIEKTLDPKNGINVDDLIYYNNPLGQIKLKEQQVKDALGLETTPQYLKYKEADGLFGFITGQRRQFYGDSIQPSDLKEKERQLDPRSGFQSPKIAKARFEAQKKLLKNELQTYRDAATNSDVYTGGQANNEDQVEGMAAPPGNVWMMTPEGDKVPVHKANINHATEKYGYKLVE